METNEKVAKKKRDEKAFQSAQQELIELASQHQSGEIDLCFFDEAGFSLTPTVPYGWQMIGEWIEIPSSRSGQINVMGVLNYDSELRCCVIEGSVNSDCVVGYFDALSETLTKKTVMVIDNAPIHTSNRFQNQLEVWEKKGLHFYFLPAYSPELNLIEILWRMIKHHWLPLSVYECYQNLWDGLCGVLRKIGTEYNVSFSCFNKES